jgi:hypothetical protein
MNTDSCGSSALDCRQNVRPVADEGLALDIGMDSHLARLEQRAQAFPRRMIDRAGPELESSRRVEFQPQELDRLRDAFARVDGWRRIEEEIRDDADCPLAGNRLGNVRPGDMPVGVADKCDFPGKVLAEVVLLAFASAHVDKLWNRSRAGRAENQEICSRT